MNNSIDEYLLLLIASVALVWPLAFGVYVAAKTKLVRDAEIKLANGDLKELMNSVKL